MAEYHKVCVRISDHVLSAVRHTQIITNNNATAPTRWYLTITIELAVNVAITNTARRIVWAQFLTFCQQTAGK